MGAYVLLSIVTVVAIAVFSATTPHLVNTEAWFRGVIVAATSVLTFVFARRVVTGEPRWLLRLRIVVAVILAAIVAVLFFLPLPGWMIAEQAVCGVLLLATAVIVFGRPASGFRCRDLTHSRRTSLL